MNIQFAQIPYQIPSKLQFCTEVRQFFQKAEVRLLTHLYRCHQFYRLLPARLLCDLVVVISGYDQQKEKQLEGPGIRSQKNLRNRRSYKSKDPTLNEKNATLTNSNQKQALSIHVKELFMNIKLLKKITNLLPLAASNSCQLDGVC